MTAHVLNRTVAEIEEVARAHGVKPAPNKYAAARRKARRSGWKHVIG